jgi:hypothetical protein
MSGVIRGGLALSLKSGAADGMQPVFDAVLPILDKVRAHCCCPPRPRRLAPPAPAAHYLLHTTCCYLLHTNYCCTLIAAVLDQGAAAAGIEGAVDWVDCVRFRCCASVCERVCECCVGCSVDAELRIREE